MGVFSTIKLIFKSFVRVKLDYQILQTLLDDRNTGNSGTAI